MRPGRMFALRAVSAAGVAVVLLARSHRGRKRMRLARDRMGRRYRHLQGRLRGARYRLGGGRPDPNVTDDVLADRVRSRLGSVTKRLDVPRVHVTVSDHMVVLHGDVSTAADATAIEDTAWRTPGVRGVVSLLHEGLLAGDTRPSEGGRAPARSTALRRLLAAAREAGCNEATDEPAVRAVLATFFERLPDGERRHVAAHLPADVQVLTVPPRRRGRFPARMRHLDQFVEAVITNDHIDREHALDVAATVLHTLRDLVPEEASDVAAVLPAELRMTWTGFPPGTSSQPSP